MAKKNSSVVALELSRSYLKLVEFLPAENQISTVAIKPLDAARWDDDAYLAEQIKHSVSKHVADTEADLVTAMSGENAIIRQVEIPHAEDNINDAIQWEMEQYLIHPLEEYLLDYQALGSNLDESARVYLVAAFRRSEVERFKRIMDHSGCSLAVLDLDVFAAQNVFEANYPEKLPLKTFLIKADSNVIKCIRTQNGQFLGFECGNVDPAFMNSGSGSEIRTGAGPGEPDPQRPRPRRTTPSAGWTKSFCAAIWPWTTNSAKCWKPTCPRKSSISTRSRKSPSPWVRKRAPSSSLPLRNAPARSDWPCAAAETADDQDKPAQAPGTPGASPHSR